MTHTRKEETWKLHASILPSKPKSPHPNQPSIFLSHQWPSWTKIYVEERKTKKKQWETKERS